MCMKYGECKFHNPITFPKKRIKEKDGYRYKREEIMEEQVMYVELIRITNGLYLTFTIG